jgi:translation initiation factor IF-2
MEVKVLGKIDLESMNQRTRPPRKTKEQKEEERKARMAERKKEGDEQGDNKKKQKAEGSRGEKIDPGYKGKEQEDDGDGKRKRKRIKKSKEKIRLEDKQGKSDGSPREGHPKKKKKRPYKPEVNEEDVQKQIKDTLARLTSKGKSKGAKYRREKRDAVSQKMQEEVERKEAEEKNVIKVTEFVSVNELASLMKVPPTEVIATCMSLGLIVSINQRLDAETMSLVADEFGYKVEFISVEVQESIHAEEDNPERLTERPPIVTVMGHVDHGKTKLLDHIRNSNVIAGEAGGITQHIGAYSVEVDGGKKITFLDTPGHEAFTAMRARGAQITDVAIIVVAADDGVKPQTVEAINHAQAAGVPMIFAINKIDKPAANPDKVKEELANMNILVEDWGGKYQSQEISAKNGLNIEELLEKVLLEAELLELKADPLRNATGTVIESSLDKGRGYVATILIESGTLKIGDIILAGIHTGRIKAMYNERGKAVKEAGPSTPVLILGLGGAPQAGDKFNIMDNEREAREIANKREQLQREQEVRTQKHITLDEIGRRIAIGNFQELNVIVKGDVDGSVEALSDSLIKLSTEEIQVNIIHKGVGQISEGDILLAAASNAIVVGFQVRPSAGARKLAEKEEIDIRLYSVIYDAIEEVKSAMEGMLSPEIKEEVVANLEVLETFKITKVGTIAGCMVKEGKIKRDSKVRLIRDGIVIYTGDLGTLKRFKDEAKEVASGLECGLNIENFNDIKVGDVIEAFHEVEVKKTL